MALGRTGGLCDCGTGEDDAASLGTVAAGWPLFGQFIAHDITADRSALRTHVEASRLKNARSPQLNLECLYGDGPTGHPYLFQRQDPAKLLAGPGGGDVLRNNEGTAIIGDPRNDSHLLVSQMHLAFVHAHNAFVDGARGNGVPEPQVFDAAARELRWHYQTVIMREFLPSLVGAPFVETLLREGPRFYRPTGQAYIPLEFADAAYRYGHSQIRHTYTVNSTSAPAPIFPDLIGFRPVTREQQVDWAYLFDAPGRPRAARAKKIDGRLVSALIALPVAVTGDGEIAEFHSLAVRDLERGLGVGLPSGEAVARYIGEEPLSADEVGTPKVGWHGDTPARPMSEMAAAASVRSARGLSGRCCSDCWIWTRRPYVIRPQIGSRPVRSSKYSVGCRVRAEPERRERSAGVLDARREGTELSSTRVPRKNYATLTFSPRGPFGPCPFSNVTDCPSRRSSKRVPAHAELWKKYSLPSSARMNPNPLSLTSRLIVPFMGAMQTPSHIH